ncbi:MAG TPA: LacI family DNA-binding transcriptional regulator [Acidobacteriaceae bacterium]|nr:LacI family DNA-binding transcriptional regulator [Acidobacteriaceae bacterium]
MTVSRALNKSGPISEETLRKVRRAVSTLNYRPNEAARSLRGGRSRSIGLIVPNFYDPFFAECAHAITVVANEHNYSVIVTTSDEDPEVEYRMAGEMLRRHVEGMLVVPAVGKTKLNRDEFRSTAIVTLDRPIKGDQFSSVLVDNRGGAKTGTSHLIEHKHKRICYLTLSEKAFTHKVRYEGYRQAMLNAGLVPEGYFNCTSREETRAILRSLLNAPKAPTAFFASNNLVMRHLLHALSEMGVAIPGEVAVAGFDDFDMADIFYPALTVVRQSANDLGRIAADLLFARFGAKHRPVVGNQIVLPVQLIIRRSCGCNIENAAFATGRSDSRGNGKRKA